MFSRSEWRGAKPRTPVKAEWRGAKPRTPVKAEWRGAKPRTPLYLYIDIFYIADFNIYICSYHIFSSMSFSIYVQVIPVTSVQGRYSWWFERFAAETVSIWISTHIHLFICIHIYIWIYFTVFIYIYIFWQRVGLDSNLLHLLKPLISFHMFPKLSASSEALRTYVVVRSWSNCDHPNLALLPNEADVKLQLETPIRLTGRSDCTRPFSRTHLERHGFVIWNSRGPTPTSSVWLMLLPKKCWSSMESWRLQKTKCIAGNVVLWWAMLHLPVVRVVTLLTQCSVQIAQWLDDTSSRSKLSVCHIALFGKHTAVDMKSATTCFCALPFCMVFALLWTQCSNSFQNLVSMWPTKRFESGSTIWISAWLIP